MSKFIVAKITEVIPIEGADNIQAARVCGEAVVVSKTAKVGDEGIFFPVDSQVSEEYAHNNNLFRHSTFNKDNTKAGFFEDNRRVKAVTLRKVKSCGYFATLDSLDYVGKFDYAVGQTFDEVNGHPICNKYISKATQDAINRAAKSGVKLKKLAETPHFVKHVDSSQFKHNAHLIPKGALLSYHSKKHGTSGRSGITKEIITLPKWKQFVNKIVPMFPTENWKHIVGSRNVVLTNPEKESFHGSEGFRFEVAKQIQPFLKNGETAFYEIVGFVNGSSIMPSHDINTLKDKAYTKKYGNEIKYKYGCAEHEYKFHIYRLTFQTQDGENVDYSQKQLEAWCAQRNLPCTLEVSPQEVYDGDLEKLVAKVEALTERLEVLSEDFTDPTHLSEGIIIRVDYDGITPKFMKSKNFCFRVCEGHETALNIEDAS